VLRGVPWSQQRREPVSGRKKKLRRMARDPEVQSKAVWMAVAAGASMLGGRALRFGLDRAWQITADRKPPRDPASRDVPWREAIMWTVASAVTIGLGQLLIRRGIDAGWARITGEDPPV
jgi:hypothetical protein